MKYTLRLNQSFPFASNVPFAELEDENILCNNVIFPGEFNPHNVRLWVIGNEFGPLCALWADCEQDAIDEGIDSGKLDGIMLSEEDAMEREADGDDISLGGNASEPYDSDHLWMATVKLDSALDFALMLSLAESRGACSTSLYR